MAHLYSQPHPGLSAAPSEREWTRDMDDMLRLHLRRSGFDFDAAAAQLQQYLQHVLSHSGMLPDAVHAASYDSAACRERWAVLDHQTCAIFGAAAAPQSPPTPPPAAPRERRRRPRPRRLDRAARGVASSAELDFMQIH